MRYRGSIRGIRSFFVALFGQTISTIGSGVTSFGVSIWLFQQTGQATELTWASAAYLAPLLLLGPLAGTVVDRHNRMHIMLGSDVLAGIATVMMLVLLRTGLLEAWHIYLLNAANGLAGAFQWPAFAASVTLMVDKSQYGRTSGFMQIGNPMTRVVAPALAASLLAVASFEALLWFDLLTFLIAIVTLWVVVVPQPQNSAETKEPFFQAFNKGFSFLFRTPELLRLQLLLSGLNLGTIFGVAVLVPMILLRSDGDDAVLATARACAAAGGIAGGLIFGYWGGPKRRMPFILMSMVGIAAFGILYGISTSVVGWAIAGFLSQISSTFVTATATSIWQRKIPPAIQGRVFSVQALISASMFPIVTALAGPLADGVFEPVMLGDGRFAVIFGRIVGNTAGSGMATMIVIGSLFSLAVALLGFFSISVREIETRVPDFDTALAQTTD